ncbi:MAG: flagellar hook-length control protein FliK [Pseudomonadaceae bacterium]|nr:flagellar hook-length control protein FliK [Pseudomonadaceae bacterium]
MPMMMPMANGIGALLAGMMGGGNATGAQGAGLLQAGGEGLPGMFGALLGQLGLGGGVAADGEALPGEADLVALLAGLKDCAGCELPDAMFVQDAEGGVAVDLQAVMVELRQTVVQLKQMKIEVQGLGNAGDLAAAFQKMGMSAEQAATKATQIETMLQLVRKMLGVEQGDDMTTGNLLAMVMAHASASTSLTPMVREQTLTVSVTTVEASAVTVSTRANVKAFQALAGKEGQALARAVAGIALPDESAEVAKEVLPVPLPEGGVEDGEGVTVLPVAAKPQEAAAKVLADGMAPLPLAPVDDGTDAGDEQGVDVQVMPVARDSAAVDGAADDVLQVAARVKPVLPEVAKAELLDAPSGLEVARLKVKDGGKAEAVLERVLTTAQVREAAAQQAPAVQPTVLPGEVLRAPAGSNLHATSFGERLAEATRADVGKQAVVQVRALADNGGGTVRMMLNPPELGEIKIEITVSHSKVEGKISASDGAVVELLARDVHMFRQGLADAGLKLGDQGLSLMLSNQGQGQAGGGNQGGHGQQHHASQWAAESETDTDAVADAAGWVDVDKLVDVRI